jgi:murein DD-endopeptidase MepM/ murein hydrolase activator NlpD
VRIPYAQLDPVLPTSMQGQLSGAAARSWLRVMPFTLDISTFASVDRGAAAASFRLVSTPNALDPALPPGGGATVSIPSPLSGQWYVGQGAFGLFSHASTRAYDLHRVNAELHPSDPFESPNNSDYPSFGEPVTAPVAGTVFSVDGAQPDLPPLTFTAPPTPPNFVFLDIGGSIGLLFSHLQAGSVSLAPGAAVAAGAPLGNVGHSGSTSWSHLHLDAQDISAGFATRPIALTQVRVGLNPVPDDPWARRLASWGIREGFLVEALPPSVPSASLALRSWLALVAVAGTRFARSSRR